MDGAHEVSVESGPPIRNGLLRRLSSASSKRIERHLQPISFPIRGALGVNYRPTEYVYFIEEGLISLVAGDERNMVEIGLIAREGACGFFALLGFSASPYSCVARAPGTAWRAPSPVVVELFQEDADFRLALMRFVGAQFIQTARTAIVHARFSVEQRLAHWILIASSRVTDQEFFLTHDNLATTLGARRPGVTIALHVLEGEKAISSTRGMLRLLDRSILKTLAGPAYGSIEESYRDMVEDGRMRIGAGDELPHGDP